MSEPGIIHYAMEGNNEVFDAVAQKAQTLASLGSELMTSWSYRSAEKAREVAAEAEVAARADRERLQALREADMPVMRQVWDERWWESASLDEVAEAFEVTGGWARNGDPMAERTYARLSDRIRERYGVDPPDAPVSGALAAEVLAGAREERAAGFVIRDREDGAIVERGSMVLDTDDRRPPGVLAADRLSEFAAGREGGGDPAGRFEIEVYDRDRPGQGHYRLAGDQAADLRAGFDEWAQRVLSGEEQAPLDRVRDVLMLERLRLRREREALQERGPGGEPPAGAGGGDPMSPREHAEHMAALDDRLADVQLRIDQVSADLMGEDVSLVTQAAVLRGDLTDEWWDTATSAEVAGVWAQVDGWSDGAAKRGMSADLQRRIDERFGVEVGPGDSFAAVAGRLEQARADRRGERIVRFRIESPDRPGEAREGTRSIPKDRSLEDFAKDELREHAGDLRTARDGRLTVEVADYEGNRLGTFNADGRVAERKAAGDREAAGEDREAAGMKAGDRRKGPEEREAEFRRERARYSDAEAQRKDDRAVVHEGEEDPPVSEELRGRATDERVNAERDLLDAEALEGIARSDPGAQEAVDAVQAARAGTPRNQRPLDGVKRAGQGRGRGGKGRAAGRGRAGRESRLGARRPPVPQRPTAPHRTELGG